MVDDTLLENLKRLHALEAYGASPEGQAAAANELETLVPRLYEVATNLRTEGLDPSQMGEIEKILRAGDMDALHARLGEKKATQLQRLYGEAITKAQRTRDAGITWGAIPSAVVGNVDQGVGSVLAAGTLAAKITPDWLLGADNSLKSGQALKSWHDWLAPKYSDEVLANRESKAALDAPTDRAHKAEQNALEKQAAELEATLPGFDAIPDFGPSAAFRAQRLGIRSGPLVQRVVKDAATSLQHLTDYPSLMVQGAAETAGTLVEAGAVQKGLQKIAAPVVEGALQSIERKALVEELRTVARAGLSETAEVQAVQASRSVAQKVRVEAAKEFAESLNSVSAGIATGSTEGLGAYDQTLVDVLKRDPKDLYETSEPYRQKVQQLLEQHPEWDGDVAMQAAQEWLAGKAAWDSAWKTGVAAMASGAALPEGVTNPFGIVSKGKSAVASWGLDVGKEVLDETWQGGSGAFFANDALKTYVDPSQDLAAGVGGQAAEGGFLAGLSTGGMKGRELVHGAGQIGAESINKRRADKQIAELEKNARTSVQNLTRDTQAFYEDGNNDALLQKLTFDAIKDQPLDSESTKKTGEALTGVIESLAVPVLPKSVQNLPPKLQKKLVPRMYRVTAVDEMAQAYNAATDPKEKVKIGAVLNDLLQPVREYKTTPKALEVLDGDGQAKEHLAKYQTLLGNIELLPHVTKALETLAPPEIKKSEPAAQAAAPVPAPSSTSTSTSTDVRSDTEAEVQQFDELQQQQQQPVMQPAPAPINSESVNTPKTKEELEHTLETPALKQALAGWYADPRTGAGPIAAMKGTFNVMLKRYLHATRNGATQVPEIESLLIQAHQRQPVQQQNQSQQDAQTLVTQIQQDPTLSGSKVTSKQVKQVLLAHGTGGDKTLSPAQHRTLEAAVAVLQIKEANPEVFDKLMGMHLAGERTVESVGHQALHNEKEKYNQAGKLSLGQHISLFIDAATSGKTGLAKAQLERIGKFVQSHNNKVTALNESDRLSGRGMTYKQYVPSKGTFLDSKTNPDEKSRYVFYRRGNANSENLAKTVDQEANLMTGIHNDLAKTFPELGVQPIEGVRLNQEQKVQPAKAKTKKAEKVQQQQQVQQPAPEVEQKPVKKPAEPNATSTQVESTPQAEAPAISTITPEHAQKLSHAGLVARLDGILAKSEDERTPQEQATANVLLAEEVRRGRLEKAQVAAREKARLEAEQKVAPAPAPTQTAAPVQAEPAPQPQTESVATPKTQAPETPVVPTVAEAHPNLLKVEGKIENYFQDSFTTKPEAIRLHGKTNPRGLVAAALRTPEAFKKFLGSAANNRWTQDISDAFFGLLGNGKKNQQGDTRNMGHALFFLQQNLQKFLQETKVEGLTLDEALRQGKIEANAWSNGKALNITEIDEKTGQFKYNQELIELAVMAGLHWQLTLSDRLTPMDDEDIAKALKLPDGTVLPEGLAARLSAGMKTDDAKRSLAQTIRRFWGVKGDPSKPMGFTEAIPEALAGEVIRAFANDGVGLLTRDKIDFNKEYTELGLTKEIDRYVPFEWGEESPLTSYPELLEDMIVVEPEKGVFFTGDKVPVIPVQPSNPEVELSREQKTSVGNQQDVEHFLHMGMVDGLGSLDDTQTFKLLGFEIKDKSKYNKNDLAAKQGKNLSLLGAQTALRKLVNRMQNIVGPDGDISQLGRKFQYVVGSNGRTMMQGAYNTQADKYMRAALLPTWSTLDLSDPKGTHRQYLMLSLAQALGEKIHRTSFQANVDWAEKAIAEGGLYAPAIDVLVKYLDARVAAEDETKLPVLPVDELIQALSTTKGAKILTQMPDPALALLALMEMAQLKQVGRDNPDQLKSFRTPLYLEADGMTNGPFNTMGLLTLGEFTEDWVKNVRKGGVSIGSEPMTADKLLQKAGGSDLYQTSADSTEKGVSQQRQGFRKAMETAKQVSTDLWNKARQKGIPTAAKAEVETQAKRAYGQMKSKEQLAQLSDHLFKVLNVISDGGVIWDGSGDPKFKRGLLKTPSTQQVYGAGGPGVAKGVAAGMMGSFYEILSEIVADPKKWSEHEDFLGSVIALVSTEVRQNKEGDLYIARDKSKRSSEELAEPIWARLNGDTQGFSFSPEEKARLQANLTHLLVAPMRAGIEETFGHTVAEAGKLLTRATNLQVSVARSLYLEAIEKKLDQKAQTLKESLVKEGLSPAVAEKKAKQRTSSEFLSKNELKEIWNSLKDVMPLVSVDGQNFLVAKDSAAVFSKSWGQVQKEVQQKVEQLRKNDPNLSQEEAEKQARKGVSLEKSLYEYSKTFDSGNEMATGPDMRALDLPGVLVIPQMVIGLGDGRMVRTFFQQKREGAIQIFDGINLPVDKIAEYGKEINQASLAAWQANVFEGVLKTFEKFADNPRVAALVEQAFGQESNEADTAILNQLYFREEVDRVPSLRDIHEIRASLQQASLEAKARMTVLSRTPISIDQMAGPFQPYVSSPGSQIEITPDMTDKQVAEALTREYAKALDFWKLDRDYRVRLANVRKLLAEFNNFGKKDFREALATARKLAGKKDGNQKLIKNTDIERIQQIIWEYDDLRMKHRKALIDQGQSVEKGQPEPIILTPPAAGATQAPVQPVGTQSGQQEVPTTIFAEVGKHNTDSGVTIVGAKAFRNLAKSLKGSLTESEHALLASLLKSPFLKDVTLVAGTREQIDQYQENHALTSVADYREKHPRVELHGLYAPGEKTIYLVNPQVESLVHELIHAATYQTIQAYYEGKLPDGSSSQAIERLESMLQAFLEGEDHGINPDSPLGQALENAQREIYRHRPPGEKHTPAEKAAALNEFMAWTLANRHLAESLSSEKDGSLAARLGRITKTAWAAIKKLIFPHRAPPGGGDGRGVLDRIRIYTSVVAKEDRTLGDHLQEVSNLAHAVAADPDTDRLSRIMDSFLIPVARHLGQSYSPEWMENSQEDLRTNPQTARAFALSTELAMKVGNLFNLSALEQSTFQMVTLALATEAKFNAQSLTEMSRLFNEYLKQGSYTDFLKDPDDQHLSQTERDEARKKFEFIAGQDFKRTDKFGRSTTLPVFVALSLVNKEFSQALSRHSLPATGRQKITGLNSGLEAVGASALRSLEKRASGATDTSLDMREAMDQLTRHLMEETFRARTIAENVSETLHRTSRGINGKMTKGLKWIGRKSRIKSENLSQSSSKLDKALGAMLKATAILASEEDSAILREAELARQDKDKNMSAWTRELFGSSGIIGRVRSQQEIYDLYKKVKSVVAQSRQIFREHVPEVIHSKFKNVKPTDHQYDVAYRTLGRGDVASLLSGSRTVQDALMLILDPAQRAQEGQSLLARIRAFQPDPRNAALIEEKIDQLVNYMHTDRVGTNLLPNAHAIASLLDEKRNELAWVVPTEQFIQDIDHLITLRYLDQMDQADQADLASLAQLYRDEPDGVEFMLNYLKGEREGEISKALQGKALFNHVKGELPSESKEGHLIVARDDQETNLRLRSYIRVGSYRGSSIESRAGSYSYYFSNTGSETRFNQGLIQNIQGTAYGVHTATGHFMGPNAGYITDAETVQKLVAKLHQEKSASSQQGSVYGAENLRPVRNEAGEIVAFQRTFDPEQLKILKQPQHLGKMIGYWRGRQDEEIKSRKINLEIIGLLGAMWDKDKGTSEEGRYTNLSASTNPVIRDALSIMPGEIRQALEDQFREEGDDETPRFMVRENLVNQIIGYRNASIGDMWTGNTTISRDTQETVKKLLISMFGIDAYRKVMWAEKNWQAVTATMRTNIVVRSMIVPMANTVSGYYQLRARGVPSLTVVKKLPRKLVEIEEYTKAMAEKVKLEAELYADPVRAGTIKTQIEDLDSRIKRLSIYPLIEAGEFSSIADVGQTAEEFGNEHGTVVEKMEALADKLPQGVRDVVRVGYLSRDTALFQGLQKWVQYSDFVMKAIYYDHLMEQDQWEMLENTAGYKETLDEILKKVPHLAEAQKLARESVAKGLIIEEFNNYDLPTGRGRGYLESIGLMWFLNYKIRAVKIGLSMLQNNPLDLLLFGLTPHPLAGGIPFTDNLFVRLFDGSVFNALGPGMALEPIAWNSWYNLLFGD